MRHRDRQYGKSPAQRRTLQLPANVEEKWKVDRVVFAWACASRYRSGSEDVKRQEGNPPTYPLFHLHQHRKRVWRAPFAQDRVASANADGPIAIGKVFAALVLRYVR